MPTKATTASPSSGKSLSEDDDIDSIIHEKGDEEEDDESEREVDGNPGRNEDNQAASADRRPLAKRRRVTRACDECRRKKIKCDGKRPCTHCTIYSYECTYDKPSNRRRNPAPQYIEALEDRLERAEALLEKLLPGISLAGSDEDALVLQEFRSRATARARCETTTKEQRTGPFVTSALAQLADSPSVCSSITSQGKNSQEQFINPGVDSSSTKTNSPGGRGGGSSLATDNQSKDITSETECRSLPLASTPSLSPSPARSFSSTKNTTTGSGQEDEKIISITQSISTLDLNGSTGGWNYHGASSGSVFLQNISHYFQETPNRTLDPTKAAASTFFYRLFYSPPLNSTDSQPIAAADSLGVDTLTSLPILVAPFEEEWPDRATVDSLCEYALSYGSCLSSVIHRPSFLKTLDKVYRVPLEQQSREERHSQALLFSIMSVGCIYKAIDPKVDARTYGHKEALQEGSRFYRSARARLGEVTDCYDVTSLQTLVFMIVYVQSTHNLNSCYTFIGIAVRAGLRMGLHRNLEHHQFSLVERELRKRIFYFIQQTDIYVSAILGHPILLSEDEIDQSYPREVDDEYILDDRIETPPPNTVSVIQAFNAYTRLMLILKRIVQNLYIRHADPVQPPGGSTGSGGDGITGRDRNNSMGQVECKLSYKTIQRLENELRQWLDELPEVWKPSPDGPIQIQRVRQHLRFTYAHVQLLLYRSFVPYISPKLHPNEHMDNTTYAYAAASISVSRNVVHIVLEMHKKNVVIGPYWLMLFSEFFAINALVLYVIHHPQARGTSEIYSDILLAKSMFSNLSAKSLAANRLERAMDALLQHVTPQLSMFLQATGSGSSSSSNAQSTLTRKRSRVVRTTSSKAHVPERRPEQAQAQAQSQAQTQAQALMASMMQGETSSLPSQQRPSYSSGTLRSFDPALRTSPSRSSSPRMVNQAMTRSTPNSSNPLPSCPPSESGVFSSTPSVPVRSQSYPQPKPLHNPSSSVAQIQTQTHNQNQNQNLPLNQPQNQPQNQISHSSSQPVLPPNHPPSGQLFVPVPVNNRSPLTPVYEISTMMFPSDDPFAYPHEPTQALLKLQSEKGTWPPPSLSQFNGAPDPQAPNNDNESNTAYTTDPFHVDVNTELMDLAVDLTMDATFWEQWVQEQTQPPPQSPIQSQPQPQPNVSNLMAPVTSSVAPTTMADMPSLSSSSSSSLSNLSNPPTHLRYAQPPPPPQQQQHHHGYPIATSSMYPPMPLVMHPHTLPTNYPKPPPRPSQQQTRPVPHLAQHHLAGLPQHPHRPRPNAMTWNLPPGFQAQDQQHQSVRGQSSSGDFLFPSTAVSLPMPGAMVPGAETSNPSTSLDPRPTIGTGSGMTSTTTNTLLMGDELMDSSLNWQ